MWFIIILFVILSIILLSGKGGFLIAGYNTASKEVKARYNAKRLSRISGVGIFIIAILLAVLTIFDESLPRFMSWLIPGIILVDVFVIIILSNTICKNQNISQDGELNNKVKNYTRFSWIFTILIFGIVGVLLFTGEVKIHTNGNRIRIEASYWPDKSISYEDILTVTLMENIEVGKRTNGVGSFRLQEGHFKNDKFGSYLLYSYTKCKSYIVIETDKETYVINAENKKDTLNLYSEISEKLE